jgi:hypothetical protein
MPSSRPGRIRLASSAWLAGTAVVCLLGSGCAEDPSDTGRPLPSEAAAEADAAEPSEGQLGRIHVVLQPLPDEIEPEPQLQISGRFVEYRGVSEDFVRARAKLPTPAWEQLVPGQCVASERLLPATEAPREGEPRELSMIDAGDLRVLLGNRELVAPPSLVPDLLPWLSGVEYTHVDDRIPRLVVEPDGTSPVVVNIDGSPDGGLEGFSASVDVPVPLALEAAKVTSGRLTIDWRPPGDTSQTLVLRLQAFAPTDDGVNEPAGEEVTCLVADTGQAALALAPLAAAGLGAEAELLRVSASRFDVEEAIAGSFGPVEILVELRTQKILPLL